MTDFKSARKTVYVVEGSKPLHDAGGQASLFIAADNAQQVHDVLALWPHNDFHLRATFFDSMDVELPGGAMALLAHAIAQWGPPPCPRS